MSHLQNWQNGRRWFGTAVIILGVLILALTTGRSGAANHPDKLYTQPQQTPEVLSYTFHTPQYEIETNDEGLSTVTLEEFYPYGLPGDPELPAALKYLAIPPLVPLDSVTLEISAVEQEEVVGTYQFAPTGPYLPLTTDPQIEADWGPNAATIVDGKNIAVYGSDTFFPAKPVEITAVSQMRKWRFVELRFWPISYNPISGKLRLTTKVTVQLHYGVPKAGADAIVEMQDTLMDDQAAELFLNISEAQSWYNNEQNDLQTTETVPGYAIITTNQIASASQQLDSFIIHKRELGFNAFLVTENEYGQVQGQLPNERPEKVRQWLTDHYLSENIKYVLLIGNPDPLDQSDPADAVGDMPMKMTWPGCKGLGGNCTTTMDYRPDYPTDHYFADLSGNWDLDGDGWFGDTDDYGNGGVDFWPEVYTGRIPVYSSADNWASTLDRILHKTIDYETSPDINWRRSALLPMTFLSQSDDGADLAETMRANILGSADFSTYRMYWHGDVCNSIQTSDQDLTHKAVRDHWQNQPYGIVTWFGHGFSRGTSLGFNGCDEGINGYDLIHSDDAQFLDDSHPALTFQISCSTGWPEATTNLGYSLLANGAIGTISGSRSTYGFADTPTPGSANNASLSHYYIKNIVANIPTGEALFSVKGSPSGYKTNVLAYNIYGDPSIRLLGNLSESGSVALADTFDVTQDTTLNVGAPGVLENDITAAGDPRLYYVTADSSGGSSGNRVHELAWTNNNWYDWNISADVNAAPVAMDSPLVATNVLGSPRIYYLGDHSDNKTQNEGLHIHELAWIADRWYRTDITRNINTDAPLAVEGSELSVIVSNSVPHVYYLAQEEDGLHVHELVLVGSIWQHTDVTAESGAPPAVAGSSLSTLAFHTEPRIYYLAQTQNDLHVHELAWGSYLDPVNATWYHRDVTAEADAPPAVTGSPLSTLTWNTEPRVYYLTQAQDGLHVHELAWGPHFDPANAFWYHLDVTAAADAPPAVAGSSLNALSWHTEPRIYYLTQTVNGLHVHELAWGPYFDPANAIWYHLDITATGYFPRVASDSPLSVMTYNTEPRVYYLAEPYYDFHIHELAWMSYLDPANADWYDSDLNYAVNAPTPAPEPIPGSPLGLTTYTNDQLSATLVSDALHGTLTLNDDGSFTYKPDEDYVGLDSFSYLASSQTDASVATVKLIVSPSLSQPTAKSYLPICLDQ